MSNFLAVATVTAALRHALQGALDAAAIAEPGAVAGATVSSVRPEPAGAGLPGRGVNVYLYQVTPNAAWRNEDLPTRDGAGQAVARPQVALDLHYLLSFYGSDADLEPQRLLGVVARTLHARPVLTREMIEAALAAPIFGFLADSDLATAIERVRFQPMPFSLDELGTLWSVFFQTSYALSMAYQGSVVLIEGRERPRAALPVRLRNVYVRPLERPHIESVHGAAGEGSAVVAGDVLHLRGRHLRGDMTRVRLGGAVVVPAGADVGPAEVQLLLASPPLPASALRAGVQGVQVVHELPMGTPEVVHRGPESNVAALLLRPRIAPAGASAAAVNLQVAPPVRARQRVALLLDPAPGGPLTSYTFEMLPPAVDAGALAIPISGVSPGTYHVRLQVDGAESLLDLDPASPTFGPTVAVP